MIKIPASACWPWQAVKPPWPPSPPPPWQSFVKRLILFNFVPCSVVMYFYNGMLLMVSDQLMKHLQHQPNQSKSNLSRQAPLSQQEADEKVISQQANQTLWLFHNRQDQTLWLFFVAVPLVIPQCIQSQSCTEDGNENPVLHTIPQQPQTSTLSSGSVA